MKSVPFYSYDSLHPKNMERKDAEVFYFSDEGLGNVLLHKHPSFEFLLVIQGNITISVEGVSYPIEQGGAMLTPPGLAHHTIIRQDTLRYERMVLYFMPEYLHEVLSENHLDEEQFRFFDRPLLLPSKTINSWLIRSLLERIYFGSTIDGACQKAMIRSTMTEFAIILRHILDEHSIDTPVINATISDAIAYINEHYTEPEFSLEDVVAHTHVSYGHLSRIFKSYTGISIYKYITQKRLEHAELLILHGESILNACFNCGFSDYTCFLKAFKKSYSLSPSEFRNRYWSMHRS